MSSLPKLRASRRARLVLPTPMGPSTTIKRCGVDTMDFSDMPFAITTRSRSGMRLYLVEYLQAFRARARRERSYDTHAGNEKVRRDLRERIQHEIPLRDAGVRNGEIRLVDAHVGIRKQIEIDAPRTPALDRRRTPELRLEALERAEQIPRRELRDQSRSRVHEVGLHHGAERLGGVQPRARHEPRIRQRRERGESALDLQLRIVEVTPERDVRWRPKHGIHGFLQAGRR